MMYGFELGREWKLSVAEIFSFFPLAQVIFISEKMLVVEIPGECNIENMMEKFGGTIKVFQVLERLEEKVSLGNLLEVVFDLLTAKNTGKKIEYGVNFYGEKIPVKLVSFLQQLKIKFKNDGYSSRFLNQNFQNLSSAIVLGQKLVQKSTDTNIVFTKKGVFVGKTIWVQNIDFYSQRDFGKKRDMQTGMLPPKLAQILINFGSKKDKLCIYDPFCGLGTILIEAALMGHRGIFGSDINQKMVDATLQNIEALKDKYSLGLKDIKIELQDATSIHHGAILKEYKIDAIVSEGYLGEIFTHQNITYEKIQIQKERLGVLYNSFFQSLKKARFSGEIILCLPFWEFRKKYYYFDNGYRILQQYCSIEKLIPKNYFVRETVSGSLLYKRSEQLVGREIFKLKLK